MAALYDGAGERGASLGASAPNAARWLGDIREYFPSSVVRVMQKDAIERLGMQRLLLEPEMLSAVEPDLNLVTTLMALSGVIPQRAKATARQVVQRVVQDLLRRLAAPMRQAVTGALKRSTRNRRPRHNEIDWNRTIRANLKHYQPEYGVIVPETRIGFGREPQRAPDRCRLHRSIRIDGPIGRLFRHLRRGARVDPRAAHARRRVRHERRRSHRAACPTRLTC